MRSPPDGRTTFLSDERDDDPSCAHNTRFKSIILLDERCCHATEIAAEADARLAAVCRNEDVVARFSRIMGPVLFTLCLSCAGWAVAAVVQ